MIDLREAAQMALETLDNMVKVDWHEWDEFASVEDFVRWAKSRASFTAEALRAALAQPEQEPQGGYRWREGDVPPSMIYTAPPQREWQGLTKEEYEAMAEKCVTNCYFDTLKYARAIEARLRDKNS